MSDGIIPANRPYSLSEEEKEKNPSWMADYDDGARGAALDRAIAKIREREEVEKSKSKD